MGQPEKATVRYVGFMEKIPLPPKHLLPSNGRFSAGPAQIRQEQVDALCATELLGTSHRASPVKHTVASVQDGLRALFSVPEGYEIALGQGGASLFWSVIAASLANEKVKAAAFGAFGQKAAEDVAAAPWLDTVIVEAAPGGVALIQDESPEADVYMYPENETSTGVLSPLYQGVPKMEVDLEDPLTVVDATSIAGAKSVDWRMVDTYYFSPQKCFGSEGGMWVAVLSPAAVARVEKVTQEPGRYVPSMLDLASAVRQGRKNQTVNTPSISTLVLLDEQIKWLQSQGGLPAMEEKTSTGAKLVQQWAQEKPYASLFVETPQLRSPVVTTVDFAEEIPMDDVIAALRKVGIYDIGGYRGVGTNQLRIPSFPNIATEDIEALLASLSWVIERL